eukprot:snap_masked-scaffold_3-processed-gene-16.51-mRNA-1 protein AED:1.00 eAED:1.00 QI:0/-1/0/0/-1/1/1/0/59
MVTGQEVLERFKGHKQYINIKLYRNGINAEKRVTPGVSSEMPNIILTLELQTKLINLLR